MEVSQLDCMVALSLVLDCCNIEPTGTIAHKIFFRCIIRSSIIQARNTARLLFRAQHCKHEYEEHYNEFLVLHVSPGIRVFQVIKEV